MGRRLRDGAAAPRLALVVIGLVVAFLVAFGINAGLVAVSWLQGDENAAGTLTWRAAVTLWSVQGWSVLVCAYILLYAGGTSALRDWLIGPSKRLPAGAGGFGLAAPVVASMVGVLLVWGVASALGMNLSSDPWSSPLSLQLAYGLLAGALAEELIVVAAPVVALRYTRPQLLTGRSLVLVITCLVAARMSYHLYQGIGSLQHLPWAVVSLMVFILFGRIWILITSHAYFNINVLLIQADLISTSTQTLTLAVAPASIAAISYIRLRRATGEPLHVSVWAPRTCRAPRPRAHRSD